MAFDISMPEQWLALYGDILYRYALARVRDANTVQSGQEIIPASIKLSKPARQPIKQAINKQSPPE
jgi:hypothetical protein